MALSLCTHAVLIGLAVLLPILRPGPLPKRLDYIRVLIYNPPPPPPPPLPRGGALLPDIVPPEPAAPTVKPTEPVLPFPETEAAHGATEPEPEAMIRDSEQWGTESGSAFGVPEGMEGGVEGGVVGGVLGGVLGGVIGGERGGSLVPVRDYDQPPRLVLQIRPEYPHEAFAKKVTGTVVLEILIASTGRVARASVIRSVPLLDQAALDAVRQWIFSPAIKHGRPVPTVAEASVRFNLY
ncbi:MAG: TonB family protein [Deltaproteobacteria bacterium]|nr:TonB family protein [Deltaproteobacteria bacterium]